MPTDRSGLGSPFGRSSAIAGASRGINAGLGTLGATLERKQERKTQAPIDALKKQSLELDVAAKTRTGERAERDIAGQTAVFDMFDEVQKEFPYLSEAKQEIMADSLLKIDPTNPEKTMKIVRDEGLSKKVATPEGANKVLEENAALYDPQTERGQAFLSKLSPEDRIAWDKRLADAGSIPEDIASDVTFDEPVEDEPQPKPGAVLLPGQKAAEPPTTSTFRTGENGALQKEKPRDILLAEAQLLGIENLKQSSNPLIKEEIRLLREKVDKYNESQGIEQGKIEDAQLLKEEREFKTGEREAGESATFKRALALKNVGFLQAKTLKELEEAAKKAEIDPDRPNDTTINKENKDIWDKLDNKYTKSISEHKGALSNLSQLDALLDKATGASDIAAIFKFMKGLDPRSVVRESEFKLPEQAGGVFNKMLNIGEKALKGKRLNPEARKQIKEAANTLRTFYDGAIGDANTRYTKLSNAAKIDPDLVIDSTLIKAPKPPTGSVFGSEEEARSAGFKNGDEVTITGLGRGVLE